MLCVVAANDRAQSLFVSVANGAGTAGGTVVAVGTDGMPGGAANSAVAARAVAAAGKELGGE